MELFELTPEVAVIVPHVPEPTAVVELRRAARTFCQDTKIWRRPFWAYVPEGYGQVSVDPVEGAALLEVMWLTRDGKPLDRRSTRALQTSQPPGPPETYYHYAGDDLVVSPVPDRNYELKGEQALQPIRTSMEIPDWLGDKWGDAIVALAAAWLMAMPDKTWTNAQEARTQLSRYQGSVAQARRDARGEGGGTQRIVAYGGL